MDRKANNEMQMLKLNIKKRDEPRTGLTRAGRRIE